jgi:hypothetical protein
MAASAGAAAAAAAAQAVKASGAVVQLQPREFDRIVRKAGDPIVVHLESKRIRVPGRPYRAVRRPRRNARPTGSAPARNRPVIR